LALQSYTPSHHLLIGNCLTFIHSLILLK
jgi:hypothetical protein